MSGKVPTPLLVLVTQVLASRARAMYLADPGYAALDPTALGVANIVIGMGIDTTTRTNLYKVCGCAALAHRLVHLHLGLRPVLQPACKGCGAH